MSEAYLGGLRKSLAAGLRRSGRPQVRRYDFSRLSEIEVTTYEPDALVRCGPPLPDDAVTLTEPVIVVEVLSPSTRANDAGAKLEDYVRLPSLRHI